MTPRRRERVPNRLRRLSAVSSNISCLCTFEMSEKNDICSVSGDSRSHARTPKLRIGLPVRLLQTNAYAFLKREDAVRFGIDRAPCRSIQWRLLSRIPTCTVLHIKPHSRMRADTHSQREYKTIRMLSSEIKS